MMFWITYTVILILCETVVIQRCISVGQALETIRRRAAETDVTDVSAYLAHKKALRRAAVDLAGWTAIVFVNAYACLDCFLRVIG